MTAVALFAQDLVTVAKDLDVVEKLVDTLPPGDVAAANKVIQAMNAAVTSLNRLRGKVPAADHNTLVTRANELGRKIAERRSQPPVAPPTATSPPGSATPRSAAQRHDLLQRGNAFAAQLRMFPRVPLSAFADETQAKPHRDQAAAFRSYLETLGGPDHPDLRSHFAALVEYETQLEARVKQARETPPAAAPTAVTATIPATVPAIPGPPPPVGAAPFSAAERHALLETRRDAGASRRILDKADPAQLADPALAESLRDGAAKRRTYLDTHGGPDHPELKEDYAALAEYDRILAEKLEAAKGRLAPAMKKEVGIRLAQLGQKQRELDRADPTKLASEELVKPFRDEAAAVRSYLTGIGPVETPDLRGAYEALAAFEKKIDEVLALGLGRNASSAQAAALLQEARAGLKRLYEELNPEAFDLELKQPATEATVSAWIAKLIGWRAMIRKGVAELEKSKELFQSNFNDPIEAGSHKGSLGGLWRRYSTEIPDLLERSIATVVRDWDAKIENPGNPGSYSGSLASWEVEELKIATHAKALEALRCRMIVDRDWYGRDLAEGEARVVAIKLAQSELRAKADAALKEARLPKGIENPTLRQAAEETIVAAKKERGDQGAVLRVVVMSDQTRTQEREHRETGDYDYSQNVDYDEFTVHTAEEKGGNCVEKEYVLRYARLNWDDYPSNQWYIQSEIEITRLLKENLDQ